MHDTVFERIAFSTLASFIFNHFYLPAFGRAVGTHVCVIAAVPFLLTPDTRLHFIAHRVQHYHYASVFIGCCWLTLSRFPIYTRVVLLRHWCSHHPAVPDAQGGGGAPTQYIWQCGMYVLILFFKSHPAEVQVVSFTALSAHTAVRCASHVCHSIDFIIPEEKKRKQKWYIYAESWDDICTS